MTTPNPQLPTSNKLPTAKSQPKGKPFDIRERTLQFALRIITLTSQLPESVEGRLVRQQLASAGTSVGANVEEADGAVSKADKRRALVIARKETRETRYWLQIVDRTWPGKLDVKPEVAEATEILYILSSIITKLE